LSRREGAGRLAEFAFIGTMLRPLCSAPEALELGDDAALLEAPGNRQWVIAKDAIVEGVHYLAADPADTVASKLLGSNLSDLAAMGAEPAYYLTVICRGRKTTTRWLKEFVQGLETTQKAFGMSLIGGDTISTPDAPVLSCTIIGSVPAGQALLRGGAKAGDQIFVSGTLGDAALGLRVLTGLAATEDETVYLTDRYRKPQPRVALGIALRGIASAAIDVSDGLAADLGHILKRSGVGAVVYAGELPVSEMARAMPGAREAALSGGDDYELLFTVPAGKLEDARRAAQSAATPITRIGEIRPGSELIVLAADGTPVELHHRGWQHA